MFLTFLKITNPPQAHSLPAMPLTGGQDRYCIFDSFCLLFYGTNMLSNSLLTSMVLSSRKSTLGNLETLPKRKECQWFVQPFWLRSA